MQKVYDVSKDKILITGLPKTDKLLNMNNTSKHKSLFYKYTENLNDIKIILFLPTFRNDPKFNLSLRVRNYDDIGKNIDIKIPSIESFKPLIEKYINYKDTL